MILELLGGLLKGVADGDRILWATKGRKIQETKAHTLRLILVGIIVFVLIVATFFFLGGIPLAPPNQ